MLAPEIVDYLLCISGHCSGCNDCTLLGCDLGFEPHDCPLSLSAHLSECDLLVKFGAATCPPLSATGQKVADNLAQYLFFEACDCFLCLIGQHANLFDAIGLDCDLGRELVCEPCDCLLCLSELLGKVSLGACSCLLLGEAGFVP